MLNEQERTDHHHALYGLRRGFISIVRLLWRWEAHWFKPRSPRADLVRAGALIIAEIERLDRGRERGSRGRETIVSIGHSPAKV